MIDVSSPMHERANTAACFQLLKRLEREGPDPYAVVIPVSVLSRPSWEEFWERTRKLSKADMRCTFERLVQVYLQTEPEYRTTLRHVWLLRDVPAPVSKRLRLPRADEGIDLIALDRHGEYWAIQAKFRSQRDQPLTRRELSTFTALAFNTCHNIVRAVAYCSRPVGKRPVSLLPAVKANLERLAHEMTR
jgi:hypothetical protein